MQEKILQNKKKGFFALVLIIIIYIAAIIGTIFGGIMMDDGKSPLLFIVSIIIVSIGWLPLMGLKVLKPQEALVLTLFGKYIGTLKGDGFYFVNPFCVAVNPAAKTQLNQSGDVKTVSVLSGATNTSVEIANKKLSLKIMTLSNNRQKINDCLGNPIEISIAVTWRIVDTAKAVFAVDNYKEYLSLQCDLISVMIGLVIYQ